MYTQVTSRGREIARIQRLIERLHSPRLQMMLIVALTGAVGWLASFVLLHAGVDSLWSRYPVAVAIAYIAFLFFLWCWLRLRRDDLLDGLDIPTPGSSSSANSPRSLGRPVVVSSVVAALLVLLGRDQKWLSCPPTSAQVRLAEAPASPMPRGRLIWKNSPSFCWPSQHWSVLLWRRSGLSGPRQHYLQSFCSMQRLRLGCTGGFGMSGEIIGFEPLSAELVGRSSPWRYCSRSLERQCNSIRPARNQSAKSSSTTTRSGKCCRLIPHSSER